MTNRNRRIHRSLFSVKSYIICFLMLAFAITCCFLLFLDQLEIEVLVVRKSAILTFINIIFLSLLFTVLNGIYRRLTVARPVRQILEATQRIMQGDFSARIEPYHDFDSSNELDVITQNFNKMAQELSGIETLRTDFISNVSHELKTPLSVIQNYASLLQSPNLPEEKRMEYAAAIVEASRRLTTLIINILKLNKLENQQIFMEMKEYDLGNQLCECILGFEDSWEKKQLDIETDLAEGVIVNNDEELLSLVWNNLLSNAVKFTPAGGRIFVGLKEEGDFAYVEVSDTGCGMSAEVGKHIFEKFYQGDTSHATQGNGLGLALVKRVVDIIGGEIYVESELSKGSTFIVKLRMEDNRTNPDGHS